MPEKSHRPLGNSSSSWFHAGIAGGLLVWIATGAAAQTGVECRFVHDTALKNLRTAGANGSLRRDGTASIDSARLYSTEFSVEVGLWIDDSFLDLTSDAAALAYRYFEHANCIFASGRNSETGDGVNAMSLRPADREIRYYEITTPEEATLSDGGSALWIQQVHWDWGRLLAAQARSRTVPKVNVLISARRFADSATGTTDWYELKGASNGVGQGQVIVVIDPAYFENGMTADGSLRDRAEDWWGVIIAHETGHALGRGGHLDQSFNVMCCTSGNDYPANTKGTEPSRGFSLSESSWDRIRTNNDNTQDRFNDPYASAPNPVTGEEWSFPQISGFLKSGNPGDVLTAPSTGSAFAVAEPRHDWFCIRDEICLTGDFNGDGRRDLAAFARGRRGEVYIALGVEKGFVGTGRTWSRLFAVGGQTPAVGDFNGDGRDDIAAFHQGDAGDVYVALSTGNSFENVSKWHGHFALNEEVPRVGDFNGDGRDDIVTFVRGDAGDVYVALSTGRSFEGTGVKWHDEFALHRETPEVGDFNGDGRDDVVAFTGGTAGDVYVALSTGRSFEGVGEKWHDHFALGRETPAVGDVDGDGRDDIVTFARGSNARVYAARSTGTAFTGTGVLWAEGICRDDEICRLAEVTGDRRADVVVFKRSAP